MYNLQGKVALVTGAGGERGLGRTIANRLAREGADIVVNDVAARPYSETEWGGLEAVVAEIAAQGRRAWGAVANVAEADQVQDMIDQTIKRFGRLDILVNNAGSRPGPDRVPIVELTEAAWDQVQSTNAKGTFLCGQAAARALIAQGEGGRIINISSTAGKQGYPRYGAYCASKFAVIGFTQVLAQELAPHQITVNAVCPSLLDTERALHIASAVAAPDVSATDQHAQMLQEAAALSPLGRMADTTDIARMVAFLASGEADYLTGLAVSVTGGSQMM
ncbi:MAG: SDR family oxidoreductase [Candidatus Latescibacteria bacterium]|nr:SDR family oxidoreductase [Candidatus Latescibacterota bacterium]